MPKNSYQSFCTHLSTVLPPDRIIRDPLRTLAYGTDASFYRLIPRVVVKAESEKEVVAVLKTADRFGLPVTFRAAGTSLSGQAVSDSILIIAGSGWKDYSILERGRKIRLQPGVIGAAANRVLLPFGRKIGPDPASINAAMIGGIAANNASGMCCGTAQNSYRTLAGIRLVLQDGTVLDTTDPPSRNAFKRTHNHLLEQIDDLGKRVRGDAMLSQRIRRKFKIKNTTGYSLNALVDYKDPFDIIEHLIIGSEGTLGFISEVVYETVVEHPHKATALIIFPKMDNACTAAAILREGAAYAVELMDRASLRSVEEKAGMPAYLKTLPATATALLVETRGSHKTELAGHIEDIGRALDPIETERPFRFTDRAEEYTGLWNIRKGLFPAVGAVRRMGTTVIIEDIVFPMAGLARGTLELQQIMERHRYHEAIIFGHALEGNLHFVFTQDFADVREIDRYRRFMDEVCEMVVGRYDGSLKGEHGTGRNMAPFVEMEWGRDAFRVMTEIKAIFDPKNLLNPGVILNDNPKAHIRHLKPLPRTDPIVDKCIECGFCESICPSRDLTLTPRQRIVARREISRLKASGGDGKRLASFRESYRYQGERTCAVDGLCGTLCPVEIDTGMLTKQLRGEALDSCALNGASRIARHFGPVTGLIRESLNGLNAVHGIIGTHVMETVAGKVRQLSQNRLPLWTPYMPKAVKSGWRTAAVSRSHRKVVYFPSCVSRTMGPAREDPVGDDLPAVAVDLLQRAGFQIIFPRHIDSLCCGTPFESKGYRKQADNMADHLEAALVEASKNGRYPILFDTSPCLYRMSRRMKLKLHDPAEFIIEHLVGRVALKKLDETVAVHVPCSAKKMGLADAFRQAAEAFAAGVILPDGIDCCGFAGDRGFTHPELNASALKGLEAAVAHRCTAGYSSSRTCEIGLSLHSGIHYRSILYLAHQSIRF